MPPLSEDECERVTDLHACDYNSERDDGVNGLRSSVTGADLETVSAKQAGD
jgi:hypothetical protein